MIARGAVRGKEVLKPWVSNGILSPLSFADNRKSPCGAKRYDKHINDSAAWGHAALRRLKRKYLGMPFPFFLVPRERGTGGMGKDSGRS